MTAHIALLRAVNVGGTGKLPMAELREFFEASGFENVRTYIQSGNVVFEGGGQDGAELEAFLEREARKRLGLDTRFLVRTPGEWNDMITANPFPERARTDPKFLAVMVLKDAPAAQAVKALEGVTPGPEQIVASGKHLYIDYPEGQGRSKLTGGLIERTLETRGTARNWNTVLKLAEMVGSG